MTPNKGHFFCRYLFSIFVPDLKSFRLIFFISATLLLGILVMSSFRHTPESVYLTKVELGQQLFFDKGLSLDSSVSCASCHIPEFAFSDTVAFSTGFQGRKGLRNAPSVMNMKFRDLMFFDGRATTLRDQVHFPISDPNEMNLSYEIAIQRITSNPVYAKAIMQLYQSLPNAENVADAIASFEETLESSETPFDRYMSGDESAISESAKRGRELFLGDKAKCFDCHFGPDFTGDEFRNIGLFNGKEDKDAGRYNVTKDSADLGKFKVPGLRNIGVTGPYMHDGRFKTIDAVIAYYNNPGAFVKNPVNIDPLLLQPLNLSKQEQEDLKNFLLTLTDQRFINR